MPRQWRCAVVGVGVVGEWHTRVLKNLPNAELAAICDLNAQRAEFVRQKNRLEGVPIYTDQRKMLASERIDVVHICTPSGNHMNPAILSMEAGKNVICEKPMEIRLDRIDRMIEAARKNKVKVAGIFQNRWNEANRVLREAAAEGRFGRMAWGGCFTPWYRTDQYYEEGGWRGTWKLDGGGAIMNQSVHAVDLLQWICGPVKTVSAYAASRIHPKIEVEDTLSCSLQFESGAFGAIMGSTAMWPGSAVRIEVGGENGSALSENGLRRFRFRDEREADKQLMERLNAKTSSSTGGGASNTDVDIQLHVCNVSAILGAWERGEEAETNGPEARKAVAIILAMYASARKNGKPVEVQSPRNSRKKAAKPIPRKVKKTAVRRGSTAAGRRGVRSSAR